MTNAKPCMEQLEQRFVAWAQTKPAAVDQPFAHRLEGSTPHDHRPP